MIDHDIPAQALDANARRRATRRHFLRTAGQMTVAAGGLSLLAACGSDSSTPTPTDTSSPTPSPSSTDAIRDTAALQFALQLAYLQAQFSSFAATGAGLAALPDSNTAGVTSPYAVPGGGAALIAGAGTAGATTGGRAVTFTDPLVGEYAREIFTDDLAQIKFLRSAIGTQAVAMPAINIDGGASGAFTTAARLAGYVGAAATFDPYASDINFLLAAFFLKDVAVTAYKGALNLIVNTVFLDAGAGLMATQAYHAGLIRTALYMKGQGAATVQFSDARDRLDGTPDIDQGIIGNATTANIAPTDASGLVYTRTAGQVLNIAFLNSAAVTTGGFFPSGINGTTNMAAASNV